VDHEAKGDEVAGTGKTMSRAKKTLDRILSGTCDANIAFVDLSGMLKSFGFEVRVRESHHIFTHDDLPEILNIQPKKGKAKPYQVKQVRDLFLSYALGDTEQTEPERDSNSNGSVDHD